MYIVPEELSPEVILSTTISTVLLVTSNCKYKSCNPITSFDFGQAETSIIGIFWTFLDVPVILTGFKRISALS